jgi:hypothetical protein
MGDILSQGEIDALLAATDADIEGNDQYTKDYNKEAERLRNLPKTVWVAMSKYPYELTAEKQQDIWTMLAFLFNSLGTTKEEIDVLPEHLQKCFTELKREENT